MKNVLVIVLCCFLGGLSAYFKIAFGEECLSQLFIVATLLLSAFLLITFLVPSSCERVHNGEFIIKTRESIKNLRFEMLSLFVIATGDYVYAKYETATDGVTGASQFQNTAVIMLFALIVLLVLNFVKIQQIRDDITDTLLEEETKKAAD